LFSEYASCGVATTGEPVLAAMHDGAGSGNGGPLSSPVLFPLHAATHAIMHQRTLIAPRYRGTEA